MESSRRCQERDGERYMDKGGEREEERERERSREKEREIEIEI